MAFEWFKRKALPAPTAGLIVLNGESSSIPRKVEEYVREGYGENPVVFSCINRIGEAVSSVKLELHTVQKDGERKVEVNGPALDLLANPNPTQVWEDFAMEMVAWQLAAGEAFVLRLPEKGQPKELHLLNPAHVVVKEGPGGVPVAYEYGSGTDKRTFKVNPLDGTSQVLHLKSVNLINSWRGMSRLAPAARAVDIHNNGSRWNSSLLYNGARPSGVIELTGTVSESTIGQLKEHFKKAWSGFTNAGNIPLLTGGGKFTPLSHNPKDMDFEKSMGASAKDIALAFGVPLPLVTMEASTFANMDAAQERFWMETVLPLLNVVMKKLTKFLMPLYSDAKGKVLAFNTDSIPALEPRRERLYKRMGAAVAAGLISPDEARAEMGFPEVGGAATGLLVPGTLRPLEDAGNDTEELVKAMKASGFTADEVADALGPEIGLTKEAA